MMTRTEFVETIKGFSEPMKKIYEALRGPSRYREMTQAIVERIGAVSDAIKEHSDMPIIYKDNQLAIDTSNYEALRARAAQRMANQEIIKQENVETIIGKACLELEGKESQSDEKISPEWMNRFINTAGEISTEEMQQLWAKILAGEAIKPSSFSLRTLECLRNLSSADAKLFEKISEFIIENSFLYNDNDLNSKYGIAYRDIIDLSDCGLISADGFRSRNLTVINEPRKFIDFGEYVLLATSEKEQIISFGDYLLSRAGRELVQIARKKSIKFDYVKAVSSAIKRNNKSNSGINITLHKVVQRNANGRMDYDTQDLMEEA